MAELVFFDVETTTAVGRGKRFWVVEFGSIVVCPKKLVEVESFCSLIRPPDISLVAPTRPSGITREAVAAAPMFEELADRVFQILNGRVWVGHNIKRFDCHRIKEAFADIGRPPPEPVGMIDSLEVLTPEFGRRAGDLKMATLASYFGLGQQKHRSLDDVRLNLEVLKHCAAVLLLESKLPQILPGKDHGSPSMVTRSKANNVRSGEEEANRKSPVSYLGSIRAAPYQKGRLGKVIERAKEALRGAEGSQPLNGLLRHSRLLLR
ncbi:hypothetical protein MA16_Dca011456 [Dendrobium catenatum]|uniref:Exonuclease domain-containing protein n=2 Tax=Dendrobium catenatum TaxID=906689 RepID=A0A2I0WK97_9ASPA|nr:hypothetical protein MA16_Dca011456 [Dendrobium catenatum]